MKHFTVIAIMCFVVSGAFAQTQEQRLTGTDRFTFTLIDNGTAYSISKGTAITGEIIIPAYYRPDTNSNYLPITSISEFAFSYCNGLTSITIPTSVNTIGDRAFYSCFDLTSVIIPESVTSIGIGPFANCSRLTNITVVANNPNYASEGGILYNKVKTILIQAPSAINSTFTIPTNVTVIGESAFESCWTFTSITIPTSVTSIGDMAFVNCRNLTSITIPASVTSIGFGPFSNCSKLTNITVVANNPNYASEGGILYNKAKSILIQAPPAGTFGSVTISANVISIGKHAFYGCHNLINITIYAGVTTIGDGAFASCNNLTSVTFATGSSITSTNFGYYTFPEGRDISGPDLRIAYLAGGAGTYTRAADGNTWTKQ